MSITVVFFWIFPILFLLALAVGIVLFLLVRRREKERREEFRRAAAADQQRSQKKELEKMKLDDL